MTGSLMLLNPRKSRKRRTPAQKRATAKLVASNRRRKRARPARRNPTRAVTARRRRPARRGAMGGIIGSLIPAAIGGAGALALDVAFGFLPIPVALKTGPFAPVVKIAGAVAVGWAAGMVTTKKNADLIMIGGVTVALYSVFKGFLQRTMPNIPMGEYPSLEFVNAAPVFEDPLLYSPDYETRQSAGMAEYVDGEMGEYVDGYTY